MPQGGAGACNGRPAALLLGRCAAPASAVRRRGPATTRRRAACNIISCVLESIQRLWSGEGDQSPSHTVSAQPGARRDQGASQPLLCPVRVCGSRSRPAARRWGCQPLAPVVSGGPPAFGADQTHPQESEARLQLSSTALTPRLRRRCRRLASLALRPSAGAAGTAAMLNLQMMAAPRVGSPVSSPRSPQSAKHGELIRLAKGKRRRRRPSGRSLQLACCRSLLRAAKL